MQFACLSFRSLFLNLVNCVLRRLRERESAKVVFVFFFLNSLTKRALSPKVKVLSPKEKVKGLWMVVIMLITNHLTKRASSSLFFKIVLRASLKLLFKGDALEAACAAMRKGGVGGWLGGKRKVEGAY